MELLATTGACPNTWGTSQLEHAPEHFLMEAHWEETQRCSTWNTGSGSGWISGGDGGGDRHLVGLGLPQPVQSSPHGVPRGARES
jgi:hypothetical protein